MIPEFIEFCYELFPSIDPYTKEQAKQAMKQFDDVNGPVLSQALDSFDLLQGDKVKFIGKVEDLTEKHPLHA